MTEKEKQARKEKEELKKDIIKLMLLYGFLFSDIEKMINEIYIGAGEWDWTEINKYKRFSKLIDNINKRLSFFRIEEVKLVKNILKNRYYGTYKEVMKGLGITEYKLISVKEFYKLMDKEWSGVVWSERIWRNTEALKFRLKDLLTKSALDKNKLGAISDKLVKEFNVTTANAQRLLRTEYARVQYLADTEAYKNANVLKVQYNSVLDANTCGECGSLHKKVFFLGKQLSLPRHPNCSCFYEPFKEVEKQ